MTYPYLVMQRKDSADVRSFDGEMVATFYGPLAFEHAQSCALEMQKLEKRQPPPLAVPPVPVGHLRFRLTDGILEYDVGEHEGSPMWVAVFMLTLYWLERACSVAAMAWHEEADRLFQLYKKGRGADSEFHYYTESEQATANASAWLQYLKARRGE